MLWFQESASLRDFPVTHIEQRTILYHSQRKVGSMSKPKIGIIVGSTRPGRFADYPAKWIRACRQARRLRRRGARSPRLANPFFNEETVAGLGPSKNEVAQRWQKKNRIRSTASSSSPLNTIAGRRRFSRTRSITPTRSGTRSRWLSSAMAAWAVPARWSSSG